MLQLVGVTNDGTDGVGVLVRMVELVGVAVKVGVDEGVRNSSRSLSCLELMKVSLFVC